MYDPYPNNFPNSGVYGERPNPMGRPMEYASKPQMRGHQMPFHQPPQTDADYHRSGAIVSASTSSSSSNSIFPRSASEALFDNTSKFRQLPCRTFISVGTCPYRERCVYLHDPRCICKEAKTKTRRKNKEDVVLDALFWPVMPYPMVAAKLDMNRQPHVIQPYSVPLPQADQYQKHDATVYSMWMHFVDFCLATSDSNNARHADSAPCYAAPNVPINSYTGEARLKFFQFLSSCNGRVVSREELMRCTGTPVALPHGAPRQALAAPRRVSDEASHPYFTSSAPPLVEVQQQQAMRQHRSLPGEREGYAPMAQQQSVLYARNAPATNPNAGFVNPGLQVNTNANAGVQGYNDPRLNHASGQSISPVSYEQRSSHVNYGSASTTQQALLQTQSRTLNGGSTSALYGPSGSLSSSTSAATSPTVKPEAPTTLSVLMNTVPQSQLSALNGTQLGSMQILGAAQADPWLVDACGLTDTEEDRDSGSSYNSVPVKQFRSVWNEASEDAAALSFNMLNGLI